VFYSRFGEYRRKLFAKSFPLISEQTGTPETNQLDALGFFALKSGDTPDTPNRLYILIPNTKYSQTPDKNLCFKVVKTEAQLFSFVV
jgi:hypothetical protein